MVSPALRPDFSARRLLILLLTLVASRSKYHNNMRVTTNKLSLYCLSLFFSFVSILRPVVAVKMARDVDWIYKAETTPVVGTSLTRRATEEAAKSDPTTGQGVVTFLQVLQQANIKYVLRPTKSVWSQSAC